MLFRNRLSRAWPWLSGVGTRWQNRQARRRRKLSERSWGLEALEVRTLMSAVVAAPVDQAVAGDQLTPKGGPSSE